MPTDRRDAAPPNPNADVASLGYEQAREELVAVVARLEAGGGSLEEALALWERGEALAARCQQWLDGARARLAAAQSTRGADDEAGGGRPGGERAGDEAGGERPGSERAGDEGGRRTDGDARPAGDESRRPGSERDDGDARGPGDGGCRPSSERNGGDARAGDEGGRPGSERTSAERTAADAGDAPSTARGDDGPPWDDDEEDA